ncbi:MAG TPA: hypothetical protein VHE33_02240 [Acidobacteriaceae bacterium]|nr:hypothetical protein [Acidobacteriaceae bacterium]
MKRTIAGLGMGLGILMALTPAGAWAEAPAPAVAAFDGYVGALEARLAHAHRSREGFLTGDASMAEGRAQLRHGEVVIEQVKTPELKGAMLHDWRGSAFVPGATAAEFEELLRDFDADARVFAPEVMSGRTLLADGDHVQGMMRVRQKHVITVVLDTTYDVRFGRLDPEDGWNASRSMRVDEIADVGTSHERALRPEEEHGFLWRINTYWTWQERDGGLYVQVESVSLTRGIPMGLGWIVGPFVESVPRESLAFTLAAASRAMAGTSRKPEPGVVAMGNR